MANIKSQKKRIITNEKHRQRNRAVKSELKTASRRVREAVEAKDGATAYAAACAACRLLDKAVTKGVIKKNQAANRKSGLMKLANTVVTDADIKAYEKPKAPKQEKKGNKKAAAKAARKKEMEKASAEKAKRRDAQLKEEAKNIKRKEAEAKKAAEEEAKAAEAEAAEAAADEAAEGDAPAEEAADGAETAEEEAVELDNETQEEVQEDDEAAQPEGE